MSNPKTVTRALVAGVIALGALSLTGCNLEEQALWHRATQTDTFVKIAATRSPGAPSDATLARLRACESHGNYGAVNRSGTYRGAYQFSRRTWNNVAGTVLPLYLQKDPAAAPPHVQDAMARALWKMAGPRQWPVCGPRAA
jgi:hypothetical protein